MAKDKDLDKKHEEDLRIFLQERSGAFERGCLLSEVTGRSGWKVELHHILGRNKPRGFKNLHPIIQEFWPHIPPGAILLTTAEHEAAHKYARLMRPLLLAWNLIKYGGESWQGRYYWEWLLEPPALEELRELERLEEFIHSQIAVEWL